VKKITDKLRAGTGLAKLAVTGALLATLSSFGGAQASSDAAMMWSGPGVQYVRSEGLALWQFPDRRALDPAIFGTPDAPLNVDLLPVGARLVSDDGSAFTTVKNPGPFSNNTTQTTGSFVMQVRDVTAKDTPMSKDEANIEASFVSPTGQTIRVTLTKLLPMGPEHQFFGGVGTNVLMHGATGIGTPLVDEVLSYVTVWGLGTIYVDGEKVGDKRMVHVMVSERTRDDDFKLGFGVANPDKLEVHLIMPPLEGSPTGMVASPVPTGVTLPNGKDQPFIHVNFYGDTQVQGNMFLDDGKSSM
jgi:hypothetical protein